MSEKITVKIDIAKISKERIESRTYQNKEGESVTSKDYKIDVVPLSGDKQKIIASGDNWQMVKAYFVVESPTPEERKDKVKTKTVGEGIVFKNTDASTVDLDYDNM